MRACPVAASADPNIGAAFFELCTGTLRIPNQVAEVIEVESVKETQPARRSKIKKKALIICKMVADLVQSYASNPRNTNGVAGIRMDIPPALDEKI